MAYISSETKTKIVEALKAKYPRSKGWKFSAVGGGTSVLRINIMQAPIDLVTNHLSESALRTEGYEAEAQARGHYDVNEFYLSTYKHEALFADIIGIIKKEGEWFDDSDSQTDYFHTAFYFYLKVGKWNTPFKVSGV